MQVTRQLIAHANLLAKTEVIRFLCTYRAFLLFIIYYLYQQMHTHTQTYTNKQTHTYIYIYILSYITSAPTCFGATAPSSGGFDITFAKAINY
jgi:hypothetical protein